MKTKNLDRRRPRRGAHRSRCGGHDAPEADRVEGVEGEGRHRERSSRSSSRCSRSSSKAQRRRRARVDVQGAARSRSKRRCPNSPALAAFIRDANDDLREASGVRGSRSRTGRRRPVPAVPCRSRSASRSRARYAQVLDYLTRLAALQRLVVVDNVQLVDGRHRPARAGASTLGRSTGPFSGVVAAHGDDLGPHVRAPPRRRSPARARGGDGDGRRRPGTAGVDGRRRAATPVGPVGTEQQLAPAEHPGSAGCACRTIDGAVQPTSDRSTPCCAS